MIYWINLKSLFLLFCFSFFSNFPKTTPRATQKTTFIQHFLMHWYLFHSRENVTHTHRTINYSNIKNINSSNVTNETKRRRCNKYFSHCKTQGKLLKIFPFHHLNYFLILFAVVKYYCWELRMKRLEYLCEREVGFMFWILMYSMILCTDR